MDEAAFGNIRFDAALLAGGRSSRFGRDKAFLEWRGLPLYAAQLRKLASLGPERLWLSTRPGQPFPPVLEGVSRLADESPEIGPLEGLRRVLSASGADWVVFLSVDLPRMEAAFLSALLEEAARHGRGAVPRTERGWEPLAAVYPRAEFLTLVEAALAAERRRLQGLLDEAEARGIVRAVPVSAETAPFLANVNAPEDLAALEEGLCDEAVVLDRYRIEGGFARALDRVASEEPLEIRVNGRSVAVTMRTPGHDEELALGFLRSEGLLSSPEDVAEVAHCPEVDPEGAGNVLDVRLRTDPDFASLTRHVFTSSSCGVCGKATIDSVFGHFPPVAETAVPSAGLLLGLPSKLRAAQETFDRTGGLHASALFDESGELLLLREDVGRHNALDKVVGHAFRRGIALERCLLLVSGRVSFELMQKALAARLPVVAGISAPSSLAVKLARRSGQTLVGFLRERGFNVYSGRVET